MSNVLLNKYIQQQKIQVVEYCVIIFNWTVELIFIRPSRDGPYYMIGYGGRAFTQVSAQ